MIEIEIFFPPRAFPGIEKIVPELLKDFDLEVLPTIETRGRQPMALGSLRKVLGLKKRDWKTVKSILRALIVAILSAGGTNIVIHIRELNTEVRIENTINVKVDGNLIIKDSTDIEEIKRILSE